MARIVIFEPEKHIRELFSIELSEQGHEVFITESCCDLIRQIEVFSAELVILDINLLDFNEKRTLRRLRDLRPELPIFIWTAYDYQKLEKLAIGADDYVIKSYDLTELKLRIERALEKKPHSCHNGTSVS